MKSRYSVGNNVAGSGYVFSLKAFSTSAIVAEKSSTLRSFTSLVNSAALIMRISKVDVGTGVGNLGE